MSDMLRMPRNRNLIGAQAPERLPTAPLLRGQFAPTTKRMHHGAPHRTRIRAHSTTHRVNYAPVTVPPWHIHGIDRGPAPATGEVPGECALPPGRILKLPSRPAKRTA